MPCSLLGPHELRSRSSSERLKNFIKAQKTDVLGIEFKDSSLSELHDGAAASWALVQPFLDPFSPLTHLARNVRVIAKSEVLAGQSNSPAGAQLLESLARSH